MALRKFKKEVCNNEHPREVHADDDQPSFENLSKYDVFLNHRGPDVKKSFVSYLEKELRQCGREPFLDAESLVQGQPAFESINEALSGVLVHVAIFSPRYAESKYCLNELCDMLASRKPLIPVFYNVEPKNLRWTEKGPFAEAFRNHLQNEREQVHVERWKAALEEAAGITGFRLVDYKNEAKLVEEVARVVLDALPAPRLLAPSDHLVGLEQSSAHVISILHRMGNNVGILGIYGLGGIGKTTLAREVYNQEQSRFQNCCFLKDVKDAKDASAMMGLQRKMVKELLHLDDMQVQWGSFRWLEKIQSQRVFLVIDDISNKKQVDELVPCLQKLAPGSRVVITSREVDVLRSITRDAPKSELYQVSQLNFLKSRDLFVWCAFRKNSVDAIDGSLHGFVEEITRACCGLPLALEIMGGSLADKVNLPEDLEYWRSAISELRRNGDIISKLQISYEGIVSDQDRRMFLDIACFMLGQWEQVALEIWESTNEYGSARWSLSRLIDKCLVKVDGDGILSMHDLVRDMGRNVVMQKAEWKPEKQSHVWDPSVAAEILQRNEDLKKVLALTLSGVHHGMVFEAEQFAKMKELKYLILNNCHVKGDFSEWSKELRWLQWRNFPFDEIPCSLKCPKLVTLDLSYSKVNFARSHPTSIQFEFPCNQLRRLILKRCGSLEELPQDINRLVKLKSLNLEGCWRLKSLPDSLGDLTELEYLYLKACRSLRSLPSLNRLKNLKLLYLGFCSGLNKLPDSFSSLSNLKELGLSGIDLPILQRLPPSICELRSLSILFMRWCWRLEELPKDFGQLHSLRFLDLLDCWSLTKLPDSISQLSSLDHLNLCGCDGLQEISPSICELKRLRILNLSGTPISELPEDFGKLQSLKRVNLSGCKNFTKLPKSFSRLSNLEQLYMKDCNLSDLCEDFGCLRSLWTLNLCGCSRLTKLPESFSELSNLVELEMRNCNQLSSLCDSFGHLGNLERLDLRGCRSLTELPASFSNLSKYITLWRFEVIEEEQLQLLDQCNLRWTQFQHLKDKYLRDIKEAYRMLSNLSTVPLDGKQLWRLNVCKNILLLIIRFLRISKDKHYFNQDKMELLEKLFVIVVEIFGDPAATGQFLPVDQFAAALRDFQELFYGSEGLAEMVSSQILNEVSSQMVKFNLDILLNLL